jgi:hypothetical protein
MFADSRRGFAHPVRNGPRCELVGKTFVSAVGLTANTKPAPPTHSLARVVHRKRWMFDPLPQHGRVGYSEGELMRRVISSWLDDLLSSVCLWFSRIWRQVVTCADTSRQRSNSGSSTAPITTSRATATGTGMGTRILVRVPVLREQVSKHPSCRGTGNLCHYPRRCPPPR